jgi:CheY-like chemotaxis protein
MLLEDNSDMSELISDALAMEGHAVDSGRTGADGIEVLTRNPPPDVIVTDLVMPIMDGVAFVTWLRAHPRLHTIPCVMISGDPSDRERALASGADAFLIKPFRYGDLRRVMDSFVRD